MIKVDDMIYPFEMLQVKYWITINEPWVAAFISYGTKRHPPALNSPAELPYQAAHNILKAHAKVWHLYDKTYRPTQNGK